MEGSDSYETDYQEMFLNLVEKYGGWVNSHAHLDRANTVRKEYLQHMSMDPVEASSYSLKVKQNLTGDLHRGLAYKEEDLEKRISGQLNKMIEYNVRKVVSFIDTTADNVGLSALDVALKLKKEYKDRIEFEVGAYAIFGLKDSEPERWNIFKEAASKADFIGGLPERDDCEGHIGYDEHMKRVLLLGKELGKPVQMHVDQANNPNENGTETLVEAVRWLDVKDVWAVHSISPSCYEEGRFDKLLNGLKEQEIGVICCPSAAISMRQLRPMKTYTHNSIARVLEMLEKGIKVKMGTDNIADVFVPSGTPDMYKEVWMLSNAVRFYNPEILAKVACDVKLTEMDRELVKRALDQDREVFRKI